MDPITYIRMTEVQISEGVVQRIVRQITKVRQAALSNCEISLEELVTVFVLLHVPQIETGNIHNTVEQIIKYRLSDIMDVQGR